MRKRASSPDEAIKLEFIRRPRPTLAGDVAGVLKALIARREVTGYLPSERQLCERLGVSRPTLRLALRRLQREGLLSIRHGQRTGIVRRGPTVARKRTGIVNCLMPWFPVYPNTDNALMMEEIERCINSAGLRLHTLVNPRYQSGDWARVLPRLVRENPADCWILRSVSAKIVQWFADSGRPAILMASPFPGIAVPAVDLDHRATARHAVGQFAAMGHRRVVLLSGDRKLSAEIETEAGWAEGCARLGLRSEAYAIVRYDGTVADMIRTLVLLFRSADRPTGLMTDGTLEAMTALTWLLKNGIRVPGEVSFICRDWDTVLDYVVPRPTCYRYSRTLLVRRVCRWVLRLTRGEPVARKAMPVLTRFDRGETLAAPPG